LNQRDDYRKFFDGHAPKYMENLFVKSTLAEVDFIIAEFSLPPGSRILDMGCGTGRHSVELARRGYRMTGVDLSRGMLEQARMAAAKAGVEIELIQADATEVKLKPVFDGAICLCEGSFGLLGWRHSARDQGYAILRNICDALKPGGRLILNASNGLKKIRQYSQADVDSGKFDPDSLVEVCIMEWETPSGKESVEVREKGYTPDELFLLAQKTGLIVEHIGGGTAGDWGRRPLKLDEFEIMLIAEKPAL
jgi:SAM-dependent methyltransferase